MTLPSSVWKKRTLRKPKSACDAFEEKVARMVEEGKDGAKENETRKAETQALRLAIDQQLEQRECRMSNAIFQGDTGKLWDLITAAIENGFIHHLGLDREDASKMRGRSVVRIKTIDPLSSNGGNCGEVREEPRVIDRKPRRQDG